MTTMTPEQRADLEMIAADEWNFSSGDSEAIKATLAEIDRLTALVNECRSVLMSFIDFYQIPANHPDAEMIAALVAKCKGSK
jgi:hypothetical protein